METELLLSSGVDTKGPFSRAFPRSFGIFFLTPARSVLHRALWSMPQAHVVTFQRMQVTAQHFACGSPG